MQFKNKNTAIADGKKGTLSYKDILNFVIGCKPAAGYSLAENERRIALKNTMAQQTDDVMEFTEAEAMYIKFLCEGARFEISHEDLVGFYADIKAIQPPKRETKKEKLQEA